MPTKTFSSRADAQALACADAITREQFNMSFGQYCGSILIEAVMQGCELPQANARNADERRASAIARLKAISQKPHDASIGRMTDDQIDQLLASRYE